MLQNTLPNTGFVRLPQILSVIPIGKSTWWSGVKAGKYPAPIKLGANTTVWRAEDIHNLIGHLSSQTVTSNTRTEVAGKGISHVNR